MKIIHFLTKSFVCAQFILLLSSVIGLALSSYDNDGNNVKQNFSSTLSPVILRMILFIFNIKSFNFSCHITIYLAVIVNVSTQFKAQLTQSK